MLQLEGMSTAKIVLFHQGSTELRRCENCVFFLPVNILTGVTRRLLGPHDTLPCVLITHTHISVHQCSILLEEGVGGSTLICPGERSLLPVNSDCLLQITLCQIIAIFYAKEAHVKAL